MRNVLLLFIFAAATGLAADAAAGKAVYDRSCRGCHGADGTANPSIAKAMNVQMADLKSASVQSMSDADVKKIITEGTGKMRPIKSLTPDQVDDVVAYVKSLK